MKISLIPNWRKCWRMFSVWCMAASLTINGAWGSLDADLKGSMPDEWVSYLTVALMILGTAGRLVKQEKVHDEKTD